MDRMTTANASGAGLFPLTGAIQLVYSKEILNEAMPILKMAQFATEKTDLQAQPGQSIQFLKYSNLSGGGQLTEGLDMETDKLSSSIVNLYVYEFGKAVKVSERLLHASFDDIMAATTKHLGRNYAFVLDTYLRDICRNGATNVTYGATSAAAVTARTSLTSDTVFNTIVIKDAVETLATNNAPKIGGDAYVCMAHPHQLRKLRDDSAWLNAQYYGKPENIFIGEVGRFEDVRFIETTNMANGAAATSSTAYDANLDAGGSGTTDVYQAIFLGENAFGHAIALEVELRDNGVEDFGRKHSLAWYGIMGAGIIEGNNLVLAETG